MKYSVLPEINTNYDFAFLFFWYISHSFKAFSGLFFFTCLCQDLSYFKVTFAKPLQRMDPIHSLINHRENLH